MPLLLQADDTDRPVRFSIRQTRRGLVARSRNILRTAAIVAFFPSPAALSIEPDRPHAGTHPNERRGPVESAAILDYLDDTVRPNRALLPVAGEPRRQCLRILASTTAACDKAIAISYERRRPSERIFFDWIARCRTQLDAALAELDTFKRSSWPIHDRLIQTDMTTVCMLGYVRRVEPGALLDGATPASKNWQRDASSIRLSRPVPRLSSRQRGISRLRPATPRHTELRAQQPASSPT